MDPQRLCVHAGGLRQLPGQHFWLFCATWAGRKLCQPSEPGTISPCSRKMMAELVTGTDKVLTFWVW